MKILLILALISIPASARETIYVRGDGEQLTDNLKSNARLSDEILIVWDESKHGKIPAAADYDVVSREDFEEPQLDADGKPALECRLEEVIIPAPASDLSSAPKSEFVKICDGKPITITKHRLVLDAAKVAAKDARVAAKAAAAASAKAERNAVAAIKLKIDADTATIADLRKVIKYLLKTQGN